MATDWTVLTGADLLEVMSPEQYERVRRNTGTDVHAGDPVDPDSPLNTDAAVATAVAEVRNAIKSVGRFPLSVTAGAVPPSAKAHVLWTAAWRLIMGTPNVQMVVVGEQAVARKFYDDACKYLERLRAGGTVEEPSDPTGVDYATAVAAENPAICLARWSDLNASDTEYESGYITTSTGSLIALPLDEMRIL